MSAVGRIQLPVSPAGGIASEVGILVLESGMRPIECCNVMSARAAWVLEAKRKRSGGKRLPMIKTEL